MGNTVRINLNLQTGAFTIDGLKDLVNSGNAKTSGSTGKRGRGRPAKAATAAPVKKGKRGRPAKAGSAAAPAKTGKRGRPAKAVSAAVPVKTGKRGRPAKVVSATPVVKTGKRGRPAKVVSNAAPVKTGKRGRPAKIATTTAAPAKTGKRGRPAKASSAPAKTGTGKRGAKKTVTPIPANFEKNYKMLSSEAGNVDKVLIAGYFVQGNNPDGAFSAVETANVLTGIGSKVTNPSQYIKQGLDSKRLTLVVKGRFRVTKEGQAHLQQLTNSDLS